jgi:hypothetical protein
VAEPTVESRMAHISGSDRSQLLLLPETIEDYVSADNSVRFIDAFVARSLQDLQCASIPAGPVVASRFAPNKRPSRKSIRSTTMTTDKVYTVWVATYELLRALKLTTIFGNPGSTLL